MSIVLTVYSKSAYKEFILPTTLNTELTLRIERRIFRIEEDVATLLENISGKWHFVVNRDGTSSDCTIENYHGEELVPGQSLTLSTRYGEKLVVMILEKSPFVVYDKYDLASTRKLTIGNNLDNDIVYSFFSGESQIVSAYHAFMRRSEDNGKWYLVDRSANGTFVNDIVVSSTRMLLYGDRINIWGLHMVYLGQVLAIEENGEAQLGSLTPWHSENTSENSLDKTTVGQIVYHRPPRNMERLHTENIRLEKLPQMAIQTRRTDSEEVRRIRERYSLYLDQQEAQIREWYQKNTDILNSRYLSAGEVSECQKTLPRNLWSRNRTHRDFLYHRLGLGNQPFQVCVDFPENDTFFTGDELEERARNIAREFRNLENVPIGIDLLKENLIGIVGGSGAYRVVYDLIAQIATQNSYTDVKMAFLTRGDTSAVYDIWSFALWFPHVWSEDKKRRYVALAPGESGDVCYDLTQVFRELTSGHQNTEDHPHYVLFVEDQSLLEGELISKYLFEQGGSSFVTTILMADGISDLPNNCDLVIENDTFYQGMFHIKEGRSTGTLIDFDRITADILYDLSRKLSGVVLSDARRGGEIPDIVSFFDLYGIQNPEDLQVEERWRRNRTYDSLRAEIGQKAGGQPCFLNLHEKYHGPHGLIAGTTGSGKSELLQTYILSLAVNYSPEDVAFFLIDYKGGGMGNAFENLPHVVGQISNLSGNLARRAMVSIKSENRRRQRLFTESGVNHIDGYTRLYKSGEVKAALPHLFIIIDEFAQLKEEEPDFMRELISVAQVGRSLGVHLILATQKPSGTVDDNIWSNSKFRVCLRVQDQKDSMEMLHKTDAAFLTHTGRGILQVGNDELYEEFQSGYCGQVYDREGNSHMVIARLLTNSGRAGLVGNYIESRHKAQLRREFVKSLLREQDPERNEVYEEKLLHNLSKLADKIRSEEPEAAVSDDVLADRILEYAEEHNIHLPQRREKNQLTAIVEYLADNAKRLSYRRMIPLWLPKLPQEIALDEIEGFKETSYDKDTKTYPVHGAAESYTAFAGLIDDPQNQYQLPLALNFTKDGNMAVCGMTMSGKSTFLQTVLYAMFQSYSPEALHVYALDFSSHMLEVFQGDPHVGGILFDGDLSRIPNLIHMVQSMILLRRRRYGGAGFDAYRAAEKKGTPDPAILLVIDDMAAFREKTEGAYDETLLQIARECAGVGIYLLISGNGFGMRDIPNRMSDSIRRVICLQMPDRISYLDALRTSQIDLLPEEGIAGRGLLYSLGHALEFQTAVAFCGDEYVRNDRIRMVLSLESSHYRGAKAPGIPFIPEKPTFDLFAEVLDTSDVNLSAGLFPFGYNKTSAQIQSIELRDLYLYLISGRARSGKTNLIRVLIRTAARSKDVLAALSVIECTGRGELLAEAEKADASYVTNEEEMFLWMKDMIPLFKERSSLRKELRSTGKSDDEIFEQFARTTQPHFVYIDDLVRFAQMLHGRTAAEHNLAGAMTNLFEKGSLLNIYFFAAYDDEERGKAAGLSVYEAFAGYKTGIHLGGMADAQSILRFDGIPYRMLTAAGKPGSGMIASNAGAPAEMVVIPLA